ncbi:hypothetical protein [Nocardia rhamnosiphila]|uniref:hypothetical protein n=1 Tax=Nocardia rhamnosiphila TaxID=426716 RepID=UPI0012DCCF51|nr:hypothetical protein [Nocardia rhamnosiphila]
MANSPFLMRFLRSLMTRQTEIGYCDQYGTERKRDLPHSALGCAPRAVSVDLVADAADEAVGRPWRKLACDPFAVPLVESESAACALEVIAHPRDGSIDPSGQT